MEEDNQPSLFGKDSKAKFRTYENIFLNSDVLFVEYSDIIRCIDYAILLAINMLPKDFESMFDVSKIYNLSRESLWEWYITRDHKDVLFELLPNEKKGTIIPSNLENVADKIISAMGDDGLRMVPNQPFANVVKQLLGSDVIKEIRVWYPTNNPVVRNDIKETFGNSVKFVYGPIDKTLSEISPNSTYVFSDITNILILEDLKRIEASSILVPGGFHYNGTNGKLKVNPEDLLGQYTFKFNFFDNF